MLLGALFAKQVMPNNGRRPSKFANRRYCLMSDDDGDGHLGLCGGSFIDSEDNTTTPNSPQKNCSHCLLELASSHSNRSDVIGHLLKLGEQ
jgi:hypothetical protein